MPYLYDHNDDDLHEFGDYEADLKEEAEKLKEAAEYQKRKFFERPTISVQGGKIHEITDKAEEILIDSGLEVYQRDRWLVQIGRYPMKDHTGAGVKVLGFVEVGKENMVEILTKTILWKKFDGRSSKETIIDCPKEVAASLLGRVGKWQLPSIRAIITAPTLRHDGSILSTEGYDEQTGIYLDLQGVTFPPIPTHPTKEQARAALDNIIAHVSEVPFVVHEELDQITGKVIDRKQVSRSVYLSGLLSGVIRTALPGAPMHAFTAPTAGSGKSILVDDISIAMTGSPAPVMTQGSSQEEMEKRLSAQLQCGGAVVSFDNCTQPIESDLLCAAISQPVLLLRILGLSKHVRVTNTAMYFATGNNLTIIGDMARRSLRCVIDPECERPENRTFTTIRPDQAMMKDRVEYVVAALTVMRAFFVAGRPQQPKQPPLGKELGSLEQWSRTVRDALIWLGEPDPVLSQEEIRSDDPDLENNSAALHQWYEQFGNKRQTTKDVAETAKLRSESMMGSLPKLINPELHDAFSRVISKNDRLDSTAIGYWIRKIKGRIIGGYMMTFAGKSNGNLTWLVTKSGQSHQDSNDRGSTQTLFQ